MRPRTVRINDYNKVTLGLPDDRSQVKFEAMDYDSEVEMQMGLVDLVRLRHAVDETIREILEKA